MSRSFTAEGLNRLWVAEPTWAGFIFLAIVLDVWSRRVVGWAIGEQMTTEQVLVEHGVHAAQAGGMLNHSDQGSQYTSLAFGQRCAKLGVGPSGIERVARVSRIAGAPLRDSVECENES